MPPSPVSADPFATPLQPLADRIAKRFRQRKIKLTLGGEPTYVPIQPEGAEWNVAAVGPTKLGYAYALADQLTTRFLPGAVTVFSPGKSYPGEVNPRWVVNVLANRDGRPFAPGVPAGSKPPSPARALDRLKTALAKRLRLPAANWMSARDPAHAKQHTAVLPLDHSGKRWISERWKLPGRRQTLELINADGPAGLRLPLDQLPPKALRRALTLEAREDALHLFLPPLLQQPCRELLDALTGELAALGVSRYFFEGYLPSDEANCLDPRRAHRRSGRPGGQRATPCETWQDYHRWLVILEETRAATVDLRSWKQSPRRATTPGPAGGNHLIVRRAVAWRKIRSSPGPAGWRRCCAISRRTPCWPTCSPDVRRARRRRPRDPDESARDLYDLDMAYQYLASLPAGEDHRYIIGETLRHLHTDISGNTHRSEISFDKFWNVSGPPERHVGADRVSRHRVAAAPGMDVAHRAALAGPRRLHA